jgi:hypothetical protein
MFFFYEVCQEGRCTPIKECPDAMTLARRIKNAKDATKKRDFLATLKGRVCGPKRFLTVCCDVTNVDDDDNVDVEDVVEIELVEEDVPATPVETTRDPCDSMSLISLT